MLNELFSERWSLLLDASARGRRASWRVPAREARRGRRLHHRVLPPRPRADEGDHRRGHPGGQLLRAHPPARDPRGLRPDRRRSSPTPRRTGEFRDDVDADFAAMLFYGAIEQLLSGWIFERGARRRRGLRARQGAGGRDDLRRARAAPCARPRGLLVEAALMWEGLARTRRQDRVLHGAAKAGERRLRPDRHAALAARAGWSAGAIRDLLTRLERRAQAAAARCRRSASARWTR